MPTQENIQNVLRANLFTPGRRSGRAKAANDDGTTFRSTWGLPLVVWGDPGEGKTTMVEDLGAKYGFEVITIVLGQMMPEDVGGFPVPENGEMRKLPDQWVREINKAERALLVIDEFTVDPDRQAASLKIFSERFAGDHRIKGSTRLIALANPPTVAAAQHEMRPPTSNRFGHLDWIPVEVDEWVDWLLTSEFEDSDDEEEAVVEDADAIERRVLEQWPRAWAKAAGLVGGYVRRFRDNFRQLPQGFARDGGGEPDPLRWPSPRVWEMATRALAGSFVHGLDPVERDLFVGAFLPAGIAAQFCSFVEEQDLPEPEDVLSGREKWEPSKRLDRTVAVLDMLAAYLRSLPEDDERRVPYARRYWEIAAKVAKSKYGGKDAVVPSASIVHRPRHKGGAGLGVNHPEVGEVAGEVVAELYDILDAVRRAKK